MDIRRLTSEISTSDQITAHDISKISELGFKSIICNRFDNEEPGQPTFREIERAAHEMGLQIAWLPISVNGATPQDVQAFNDFTNRLPKPILAYCKSGARTSLTWLHSHAQLPQI